MRTKNSMKNIYISILTQIIITLLGFISRKIFIDSLGTEYLGVNGLLTNVLSMLSLVEGGIGTSIVYNLYKPLSKNDESRIIALVQLYKKIYGILAIVIFGLSANEVLNYNKFGGYSALDLYNSNRVIKRVVDDLVNGFIPNMEKEGRQIYDSLITYNDEYFVLRDMENYIEAQEKIDRLYKNKEKWNEMALINIANSGVFSSDRTIAEYAEDIWFKGCE